MLCVWLAKGGRKRSKSIGIQLIIHSTKHGINLTLIELDKASIFFKPQVRQNHKKFDYKMGPDFEKVSCKV